MRCPLPASWHCRIGHRRYRCGENRASEGSPSDRAHRRPVVITAVSARTRDKDRGVNLASYDWEDDPVKLATRDDVDVFVELMGGSDGPAKAATEAAIAAGKTLSRPIRQCLPRTARIGPCRRSRRARDPFEAPSRAVSRSSKHCLKGLPQTRSPA